MVLRGIVAIALLWAISYVVRQEAGAWYSRPNSLESARQALAWAPNDPQYAVNLARLLANSTPGPRDEIISLYQKAVKLNPHQAEYWAELADACEWSGRDEAARSAYQEALRLFPLSVNINWQAANFYLRSGDNARALAALRKVIAGDASRRLAVFDVLTRAGIPEAQVLSQVMNGDAGALVQYVSYLAGSNRIEEAAGAWQYLLESQLRFDPRAAFAYLDALIAAQRISELSGAWSALAQRNPEGIEATPPKDGNLINDGDFRRPLQNGGLGWRVVAKEGTSIEIGGLSLPDGAPTLGVHFDGRYNLDYSHLYQYVPVGAGSRYEFSAVMRTDAVTSDSGARFQILDAYSRAKLFIQTPNLTGSCGWTRVAVKFRTGRDTRLLMVILAREPSRKLDNRISGTVWVSHVTLRRLAE